MFISQAHGVPLAIGHWGPWLLAPAGGEFDPGPYAYTYIHMYMFLHICTHTHFWGLAGSEWQHSALHDEIVAMALEVLRFGSLDFGFVECLLRHP